MFEVSVAGNPIIWQKLWEGSMASIWAFCQLEGPQPPALPFPCRSFTVMVFHAVWENIFLTQRVVSTCHKFESWVVLISLISTALNHCYSSYCFFISFSIYYVFSRYPSKTDNEWIKLITELKISHENDYRVYLLLCAVRNSKIIAL